MAIQARSLDMYLKSKKRRYQMKKCTRLKIANIQQTVLLALAVLALIVTAGSFVIFIRDMFFKELSPPIVSGQIVNIETSRVHHIIIEDSSPSTLMSHAFIFTHTETGQRHYSFEPLGGYFYAIRSVTASRERSGDHFGHMVARVELEAGSYVVEFDQHQGTGHFLIGHIIGAETTIMHIVRILILCVIFVALLLMFLLSYERYKKLSRNS